MIDLEEIRQKVKGFKTIGIPYKYGCGIAKGDWVKVEKIFKNEFEESELRLQIWKKENKE